MYCFQVAEELVRPANNVSKQEEKESKCVPGGEVSSAPAEARLRASPFLRMPFFDNPCNTAVWPVENEAAARSGTSAKRGSDSADRPIGLPSTSVSSLAISISSSSASADILAKGHPHTMRNAVAMYHHVYILSWSVGNYAPGFGST